MSELKIHHEKDDAIDGEKLQCRAEKIIFRDLSGQSGTHRKQGAIIQNGLCWIDRPHRFFGIMKL